MTIHFQQFRGLTFKIGYYFSLYAMALVLMWIGIFKFTPTEASAIQPLMVSHPFFSWMYHFFTVQAVSNFIGVIEIITALCLLFSPFYKVVHFSACIGVIITFLVTLSFLFTMKESFRWVDGVLITDFFILKDLVFLGYGVMLITLFKNKELSK